MTCGLRCHVDRFGRGRGCCSLEALRLEGLRESRCGTWEARGLVTRGATKEAQDWEGQRLETKVCGTACRGG